MASPAPTHAPTYPGSGISATPLSRDEARTLTQRINATAGDLCLLLLEAHERQAWRALGYSSWTEYATEELNISRSYAYRQLDLGRVTLALAAAVTGDDMSPNGDTAGVHLTEIAAREIKPLLPEVTEEIRERVQAGEPAAEVVPDVVQEAREIRKATAEKPARKPEPAGEEPEDHAPDIAAELEDADRRIRELEAENASLRADDAGAEIRRLSAKCAQLNATNMGLQRTITELRGQAERQGKVLSKARKALRVEKDSQIVPAIEALQG